MFRETKSKETLRFQGNKIYCFPGDQSLASLRFDNDNVKDNATNQ